ncbi:B12-binding domain-containing radical SAM protein [Pseudodesulfovibrio sp.]|uniref:B12-binding domain-containing radical SAM protein n=1 Tax=unclassified Pseudodesulfovibrio TaxID=2661612 RepID=UPI003AFF8F14
MQRLKIVLTVPNNRWTEGDESSFWHFVPYNLCMLASMIRDMCDVEILDANFHNLSAEAFVEELKTRKPDVVGVTVLMDQFANTGHKAAELAHKALPGVKVVMGGVYTTMNPERAIADENVDMCVIGEGEYVMQDLVRYYQGEGELPQKGIIFRKDGKVENRGRSDFIQDLDALPLPAYDLIEFPEYCRNVSRATVDAPPELPYAWLLTSRGCPMGCCFCQVESIQGKKNRMRSAESVLNELEWLKREYGIKSFVFMDDNLYVSRKRLMAILDGMIERDLVMPWVSAGTAVFRLDEELLVKMKESGCRYICVAIESGTERILKEVIRKPVEYEHAKKMVKLAKSLGIYVGANFIVGFPTETWQEIRQSIRFAEELDADYIKLFHAIPLRHTKLWELCEKHGAFKDNFDVDSLRWSDGQIASDEFSNNDLTVLRAYEWDRINFTDEAKLKRTADMMHISVEELNEIRRETRKNAHRNIWKDVDAAMHKVGI